MKYSSKQVVFKNKMQRGKYLQSTKVGDTSEFKADLTPKQMLNLGVFEGMYLNSCKEEYPSSWFSSAKLSSYPDIEVNLFKIKSRQPLSAWKTNNWLLSDPRGWFEWYCRYYNGRRIDEDKKQIGRYNSFARHAGQVIKNGNKDISNRPKQRQALLQWARDPFPDFKTKPGESIYKKIRRVLKENK